MELKPHFDILVPGTYFCDVIFTGLPSLPTLGSEIISQNLTIIPGGTINHVMALRRLGVNVGWIGAMGNDFFSKFVLEAIRDEDIDTSLVSHLNRSLQQVTVSLSFPQDRAFVTFTDPPADEVGMVLDAMEQVTFRHLHFCGLEVDERMPDVARLCHAHGAVLSMDCQHTHATLDMAHVRKALSELDLFMPNASEAMRLTGTDNLDEAAKILSDFVPYLVVKNGAEGASAYRNGERYHEPALKLKPVDTTGAGDVFNAGFLAAHLEGYDTRICLRWGNYCGGMSTLSGGPGAAPTRAQLNAWLAAQ
jgi:sugar/nucleoside kinase (ribokinase family)